MIIHSKWEWFCTDSESESERKSKIERNYTLRWERLYIACGSERDYALKVDGKVPVIVLQKWKWKWKGLYNESESESESDCTL